MRPCWRGRHTHLLDAGAPTHYTVLSGHLYAPGPELGVNQARSLPWSSRVGKEKLKVISGDGTLETSPSPFRGRFIRYLSDTPAAWSRSRPARWLCACVTATARQRPAPPRPFLPSTNTSASTQAHPVCGWWRGGHGTEVPATCWVRGWFTLMTWSLGDDTLYFVAGGSQTRRRRCTNTPQPRHSFPTPSHRTPQGPQERGRTGQGSSPVPHWTTEAQCVGDLPMIAQEPQRGSRTPFTLCFPGLPSQSL